jgi:hypothetical protein
MTKNSTYGKQCSNCSVVDRHRLDADTDRDPTFHFDADTDPDTGFTHVV